MAISYAEASNILEYHARQRSDKLAQEAETVPVENAIGRVCNEDHRSPCSTPKFDTSAMDGYAICSEFTKGASSENPLTLWVKGTMAAGDEPLKLDGGWKEGFLICTEIMTGAQFPDSTSRFPFDACIRIEDTVPISLDGEQGKYVQIRKPASANQNRRFSGADFKITDLIISAGCTVRPQHVMAFASLGIKEVRVHRRLKVGVMSTGSELISSKNCDEVNSIHDSNRPFIMASLRTAGVEVIDLGIIEDECAQFEEYLARKLLERPFDVIITTGAVSKGKFDFVRGGIETIAGKILFHNVAVRPGHPILFASLPSRFGDGKSAFFGLPGNPAAAAACLRFFVIPYLRGLYRQPRERSVIAQLSSPMSDFVGAKPSHLQVFWHGRIQGYQDGVIAHVSSEQESSKVRPLLAADCWISFPPNEDEKGSGALAVETYPMHVSSLGSSGCELGVR